MTREQFLGLAPGTLVVGPDCGYAVVVQAPKGGHTYLLRMPTEVYFDELKSRRWQIVESGDAKEFATSKARQALELAEAAG